MVRDAPPPSAALANAVGEGPLPVAFPPRSPAILGRFPSPLDRQSWGIESGLHQRLDISYNDDRCRVQSDNGLWIFGAFRRLANSLFMEWRGAQRRPDHVTTTDFRALLTQENRRRALRLVTTKNPSLKKVS